MKFKVVKTVKTVTIVDADSPQTATRGYTQEDWDDENNVYHPRGYIDILEQSTKTKTTATEIAE